MSVDRLVALIYCCSRINISYEGHFSFQYYIVIIQVDNNLSNVVRVLCLDGILSYSMPQGDKRSPEWEFYDSTYDGYWDDELQRGLGQLTDGKVGLDNFRMGYYDTERGEYLPVVFYMFIIIFIKNYQDR